MSYDDEYITGTCFSKKNPETHLSTGDQQSAYMHTEINQNSGPLPSKKEHQNTACWREFGPYEQFPHCSHSETVKRTCPERRNWNNRKESEIMAERARLWARLKRSE